MRKNFFIISLSLLLYGGFGFAQDIKKSDKVKEIEELLKQYHNHNRQGTSDSSKICSCGTKLKWSAKCLAYKKKCTFSCNGKGTYSDGTQCNVCEGKGWYWDYKPGYYCPKCGNKYSD